MNWWFFSRFFFLSLLCVHVLLLLCFFFSFFLFLLFVSLGFICCVVSILFGIPLSRQCAWVFNFFIVTFCAITVKKGRHIAYTHASAVIQIYKTYFARFSNITCCYLIYLLHINIDSNLFCLNCFYRLCMYDMCVRVCGTKKK